ncbi:MAG: DnaA regulatory inactivator Hda, partial [Rhodoferax sp.]|nr:DnaA regulatory inactivator Hda [Rhodoferax sp.]
MPLHWPKKATQTFDFAYGLLHCAAGVTGINFANFPKRPFTVRQNCSASMKPIQLPLGVRLRDDATFINYYPGANAAALGYVERLCEADAGWTESLIYLWGKQGVGRTHLLQAACLRFEQTGEPAVYLPLAQLIDRGVELLDHLEQYELVCLDDLQAVAGKPEWEEALFHLFNRLRDSGRRLLIAASHSPRELAIKLPDLKSRLTMALIFQMRPLSDEDKLRALQLRASRRGLHLTDEV